MINKERLNKIIQEEVQKLLNEQPHVKAMLVYEHIEETLGADAVTELEEMSLESIEEIDEVAPPGKEKMVKKLKKTLPKTYTDPKSGERKQSSPWAIAWSQYNKKNENSTILEEQFTADDAREKSESGNPIMIPLRVADRIARDNSSSYSELERDSEYSDVFRQAKNIGSIDAWKLLMALGY